MLRAPGPMAVIALIRETMDSSSSGDSPIASDWLFASSVTCREPVGFGFHAVPTLSVLSVQVS